MDVGVLYSVITLVGGASLALLVRAGRNIRRRPTVAVADAFARDAFSTDTVNIAHVRVAGLGGLGLVLVSLVVTFQYALLTAAAIAGLVGGIICGAALILHRSHRLGSSTAVPPFLP
jgi:cadmium resistance protein CadD (predicted permease)